MQTRPTGTTALSIVCLLLCASTPAFGQTGTAYVRHAAMVDGTIEGSLQQMLPEPFTLDGGATVTADWLVPGSPAVRIKGKPTVGAVVDGSGGALPADYVVTFGGNSTLGRLVKRTDATAPVAAPRVIAPSGTRDVTLNSPTDVVGPFSTLRDLKLSGKVGNVVVPPGAYGEFSANGETSLTLGQAGAAEPVVYHFQRLVLHARAELRVLGPVVVNLATGLVVDGAMGTAAMPGWLVVNVAGGDVTLTGDGKVHGFLNAPASTVTITGGAQLLGGLAADRLEVKGGAWLRLTNRAPVATAAAVEVAEDTSAAVTLSATDADGDAVQFKILTSPSHGTLTGSAPRLQYIPSANYAGADRFTFSATDGRADSAPATVTIAIAAVNDRPTADGKTLVVAEDTIASATLSGSDADGDALRYEIITPPAHGSLSGNGGAWMYTPALNFNGPDSFTYVATDGQLRSEPATVTITVTPINDAPVAASQSVQATAGASLLVTLLASDPEGDALTYAVSTAPAHGTLSGSGPQLTYTAPVDFNGTDTFSYKASDGHVESAPAIVTITVAPPPNRAPRITSAPVAAMELRGENGGPGMLRGTVRDFSKTHPNFEERMGDSVWVSTELVAPFIGADRTPLPYKLGQFQSSTDTPQNFYHWYHDAPGVNYSRAIELPIAEGTPGSGVYSYRSDEFFPIDNEFYGSEGLTNGVVAHNFLFTTEFHTRFVYHPGQSITIGGDDSVWLFVDDRLLVDLGGVHLSTESTAGLDGLGLVPGRSYPMDIFHAEQHTGGSSFRIKANMAFETAETYRYAVAATDPDNDSLTYALTQAPAGMKIDAQTGVITWLVDRSVAGAYPVAVQVRDAAGLTDTQSYTLNIDANSPPTISWPTRYFAGSANQPVPLSAVVSDDGHPAGQPLSVAWSKLSGPGSATFSTPTGATTNATFSEPGLYVVQLRALDGSRESTSTAEVRIDTLSAAINGRQATSWWPGNDTPEDVIGGRHADALYGTNYSAGVVGSAFTFDGVNDIVRVRANPDLDLGAATLGFTIEFWMRCETDTPMGAVLGWRTVTNEFGPAINLDNYLGGRRLSFTLRRPDGTDIGVGGEQLWSLNQWVHLVFTYDRSTGVARVYRDGALRFEQVVGALALQTAKDLWWGAVSGINGNFFRGKIDEVLLYRRPLPQAEVYANFAANSAGNLPPDGNKRPSVNAGADVALRSFDQPLVLTGTAADDGLPAGGSLRTQWTFVSGPAAPAIVTPSSLSTSVTLPAAGTYVFKLTAADGEANAEDYVEVKAGHIAAPRPAGLVAWWPGNDTAAEMMRGLDGSWNNAATYATGAVSSAFGFDGVRRVTVPAAADLKADAWAGLSLEFWIRPTAAEPGDKMFLAWRTAGGANGVNVRVGYFGGWLLGIDLVDTAGQSHSFTFGGLTLNDWQHIVVTYDRGTGFARAYRNGAQAYETALGSFAPQTAYDLHFGNVADAAFRGSLDEVAVYQRALTSGEAYALYSAGAAGKEPAGPNVAPIVTAGPDSLLRGIEQAATLAGAASDDGLPAGNGLTIRWSKLSGPGAVAFASSGTAATTATFEQPGIHVLRLEADDGLTRSSDLVEVRVGPFSTVDTSTDIVAWWSGNYTTKGEVGGLDAQWVGVPRYSDSGAVASAFEINGSGYLRVPASPQFDASGWTGLSLEFWARPSGMAPAGAGIPLLQWRHPNGQAGVSVEMSYRWGWNFTINLPDVAGQAHAFGVDGALVDNTWQHIVIAYDRATGRAQEFRNGNLVAEVSLGSFTPQLGYDLLIGRNSSPGYLGSLDEIAVYRRALTPPEVAAVYAAGGSGRARSSDNAAPQVNAGPDVLLAGTSANAALAGTVTDDGRPFGAPSITWSVASAPDGATVTFGDSTVAATTVAVSMPGTYLLRLSANDGYAATQSDLMELRVAPGAVDSPADLAAWWPGNGSAVDLVGGHTAEVVNGAGYAAGRVLQGFAFDGTASFVRVNGHADLNVGASPNGMTIEFWARWDLTADRPLFAWMNDAGTADYVRASTLSSGRAIGVWVRGTDGQDRTLSGPATLTPGQFTHVAVTYDRGTGVGRLYYNGAIADERALGTFTPDTGPTRRLWIGSRHDTRTFKGVVDEFTLYRRALAPAEIAGIATAGPNGKTPPDDNAAPTVSGGPDVAAATLASPIVLAGVVSDDGKPFGAPKVEWRKVAGPGVATFADPNAARTSVTVDAPGTYLLEIVASDGLLASVSDQVEVRAGTAMVEPASQMSAWWPANQQPNEVVAGNATFSLRNGATYDPGLVLHGFSFDGTDDYAWTKAHADTDVGASAAGFTVEFWVRPVENRDGAILSWGDNGIGGLAIYQGQSGREIEANFRERSVGTDRTMRTTGTVLTAGQWTHIAVTHERAKGEMRIYANGVLRGFATLGTAAAQTQYPLVLGRNAWNTSSPWRGTLDELALYKRPLTAEEIWTLYSGADGKSPPDHNTPPSVDAGRDLAVVDASGTAVLAGRATDDNLPFGLPAASWRMAAGPGTVTFADAGAAATTATFSAPGTYRLELSASDHYNAAAVDDVEVRVGVATAETPLGISAWWPANRHDIEAVNARAPVELMFGATYAPGKVLEGWAFDGVDDIGRVAPGVDTDIGGSAAGFSVEFWVKPAEYRDGMIMSWMGGNGAGLAIYQYAAGREIEVNFRDRTTGADRGLRTTGNALTPGQWTHVAVTQDRASGEIRIYVNGALRVSASGASFAVRTQQSLVFGRNAWDTSFAWKGTLDEVALYQRPLSSEEIQRILAAGADGKSLRSFDEPPVLSAGPDVVLGSTATVATLNGIVFDDDRPFGRPGVSWSAVDGPGAVAFAEPSAARTTATFSAAGTYVLKLSATDRFTLPVSDVTEVRVAVPSMAPPADIAAWWPANGHAREIINGNRAFELMGGVGYAAGKVSQGFLFDGVDDQARALPHADTHVGASAVGFTLEFWVRPDRVGQGDFPLVTWHSGSSQGLLVLAGSNGTQPSLYLRYEEGGTNDIHPGTLLAGRQGQWVHLAYTYERATGIVRVYRDGVLASQQTATANRTVRTNYTAWLGRWPENSNAFKGMLDELTLYRRPLGGSEIAAIYTAGSAGKTAPLANEPPLVFAGADVSGYTGAAVPLVGLAADDGLPTPPAALTYQWSKVSGPGNAVFSAPTSASTTATFDSPGVHTVRFTASDSSASSADEVVVTVKTPASQPPIIAITQPRTGTSVPANLPVTLMATANDPDGAIAKVEFLRDGAPLGLGAPVENQPGVYSGVATFAPTSAPLSLSARATDNTGVVTLSLPVSVTVVDDDRPPFAEITSPDEDARISAPVTIKGVAASPLLASWTLERRLKAPQGAAAESWTTFASGTTPVGTAPTENAPLAAGTIATFDPSRLLNGIHELRLTVTDTAGRIQVAGPITVLVEGNMKVGAFTLAFEDLKVPVAGIPITITRTYDSRDARMGDFGPGWRLAVNNIRVQKNRHLGTGWWQTPQQGSGIQFYNVEPVTDRIVSVVMPDGETHRFRAGALVKNREGDPDNASFAVVVRQGKYRFYPIGDTTSKLEPLNAANELGEQFYIGGTGDQDLTSDELGATLFNPARYRLTTADGSVFILDEVLGLIEMHDTNGNTLVLNRDAQSRVNAVTSTQAADAGPIVRSVSIGRDATGRIDYIRDPAGKDLDYLYDPQGRLASFVNREANVTQFRYELSSTPGDPQFHYLTKILDPRGVAALRSEYDSVTGRLVKQIDADGKETVFAGDVDTTGRFEKVKDRLGNETTFYYDERGNVTLKIDPLGARMHYAYWPDSDRTKFETDHYGNVKSMAYDARGNVVTETIGASVSDNPANPTTGYTTRTTYNALGAPTSLTDPDGRLQTFTYADATNNLLTHTLGGSASEPTSGDRTRFTYNQDGTVATITDALGNVTRHEYNYGFSDANFPGAVRQVTVTIADPAGTAGSDPANTAETILRTTRTLFDAQENQLAQVVRRTLPDGSVEDVVTRYVYDAENRARATIMPDGRVTETKYTSFGKQEKTLLWKSVTDFESQDVTHARVTAYDYDTRGNQTSVTYADGTTERSGFDAESRRIWSQDRRGYRTFFVYDAIGRLRYTIYPDANDGSGEAAPVSADDPRLSDNPRSETQYDLIGRVRFQIDERGAKTEFTYDDNCGCSARRKQMIQHRAAGNLVTQYAYDKAGNVRFVTDPRGNTVETRYDDRGRQRFVVHPATDEHPVTQTETRYDALGHRVELIDQEGKSTRYRYDGLGRLVEVRQYPDQSVAPTDADLHLAVTDARVVSTRYAYDELGSQTVQTDTLGRTTRYQSDAMGRRTKRILPEDGNPSAPTYVETLQYDAWGNLWKRTDFAGKTTTFTYDVLNRLTAKSADPTHPSLGYTHAISRVEYDYDGNGARTGARTFNGANVQLYAETTPRDERGRVDYKDAGPAGRLDYSYHANGLLKDVVSSNAIGVNIGYRYDELNRLEHVDDASSGVPPRTTSYAYNANGSLETVTQPNGIVHAYTYDALNRLRTLQMRVGSAMPNGPPAGTLHHSYEYGLRPTGHRWRIFEALASAPSTATAPRTTTYDYDALYRLTSETIAADPNGNNGVISYTLDKVGNRGARISTLASVSNQSNLTYNARDWLNGDTYNANGSTLTTTSLPAAVAPAAPDIYDFEERLIVRARADGTSVNITYDADGHRVAKNILTATGALNSSTSWLVDTNNLTGYAQVFEERVSTPGSGTSPGNTRTVVYAYGSDLISQTSTTTGQNPVVSYFAYDGHGSTRELTDERGTVTDRYDYDAFGVLTAAVPTTGTFYLYTAEQYDPDLELYYLRARYFSPNSGRFWSMDPFAGNNGDPGSHHKYGYTGGNPVTGRDPSGLMTLKEVAMAAAVVGITAKIAVPALRNAGFNATADFADALGNVGIGLSMLIAAPTTGAAHPSFGAYLATRGIDYMATGLWSLFTGQPAGGTWAAEFVHELTGFDIAWTELALDLPLIASAVAQLGTAVGPVLRVRASIIYQRLKNLVSSLSQAKKIPGEFSVGIYEDIRGTVTGMDAHHVGQKAVMANLIPGYDSLKAPAILVSKVGHTIRGPNGIVSRKTLGFTNARDVIARDIMELRRVYPDVPTASLQELIQLNKDLYPNIRTKL